MRERKIQKIRELLDVGNRAIGIETKEYNQFITPLADREKVVRNIKSSLFIEEGEVGLRPVIYSLSDGIMVKGLSKRTKDGKIMGVIKAESNGVEFCSTKLIEFKRFEDLERDTKELAVIMLKGNMRYHRNF